MAYNFFSLSTTNYGHVVWCTTCLQNKRKLIAEKKAIRILANVLAFFHTGEYCDNENFPILNYSLLYDYRLIVTYKTVVRDNNVCLLNFFNLKPHVSAYNTRNKESWTIPTYRTSQDILPALLNHLLCHSILLECIASKSPFPSLMAIEPL